MAAAIDISVLEFGMGLRWLLLPPTPPKLLIINAKCMQCKDKGCGCYTPPISSF